MISPDKFLPWNRGPLVNTAPYILWIGFAFLGLLIPIEKAQADSQFLPPEPFKSGINFRNGLPSLTRDRISIGRCAANNRIILSYIKRGDLTDEEFKKKLIANRIRSAKKCPKVHPRKTHK